jgi:hypothetical protein
MTKKEQAIDSILTLAVQGRYTYLKQQHLASEFGLVGVYMEQAVREVGELFKQAGLIGEDIE